MREAEPGSWSRVKQGPRPFLGQEQSVLGEAWRTWAVPTTRREGLPNAQGSCSLLLGCRGRGGEPRDQAIFLRAADGREEPRAEISTSPAGRDVSEIIPSLQTHGRHKNH